MYKKDGCVWPDYNTYKLDCRLSKEISTYTEYKKRHRHHRRLVHRLIDEVDFSEHVCIKKEGK